MHARAQALQRALLNARISDAIPDVVLFLEHHPVVTLGARGRTNHLLVSEERLAEMGIDLVRAERGGDVTFHGPGQLVMYPVLRLGSNRADSHGYLHNLEEIAIRTAASFGVAAYRRPGLNGAWTDAGKLAAIGFRLKRWVTFHGMSFNVRGDLPGFQTIVPCGLVGERVATLQTWLGSRTPAVTDVRAAMAGHFEEVCRRQLSPASLADAPAAVRQCLQAADREV